MTAAGKVASAMLGLVLAACGGEGATTDEVVERDAALDGTGDAAVETSPDATVDTTSEAMVEVQADATAESPRVQVVLFTHIEDQTPAGPLGSEPSRTAYANMRAKLIELAELAATHEVQWVLQPDWKFLEAARLYEDAATVASTAGKNLFVYLHEDLGVVIDPHSHEKGGYNYTDVAHLIDLLGVASTTVIGGHIWDPALDEFQAWDRFRNPIHGEKYPDAVWRGDILIGSGTPNHVNDPLVSGVWRPQDADHYFTDDPAGNIVAIGSWHDGVNGVQELVELYANGTVPATEMLTASWNITPAQIMAPDGPALIVQATFLPLKVMEGAGKIELTDFTTLVQRWRTRHAGRAYIHRP